MRALLNFSVSSCIDFLDYTMSHYITLPEIKKALYAVNLTSQQILKYLTFF